MSFYEAQIEGPALRDQLGRRNRLQAQPTGKRVTLQARDWLWLEALARHGPLSSSFLLAFAQDCGVSEKRAKERLTDLFNETNTLHDGAYLIRPPQQFATIDSRYNQLVYDLAPAARKALAEKSAGVVRVRARSGPWLHQFMTSSITASIELAAKARSDLKFISEETILRRAGATLSCETRFPDPTNKREVIKSLTPDALFGLEYVTPAGNRYRFFAVEADRSTEPAQSADINRKSLARNFFQYRDYVVGGRYKEHLNLSSPLLVLNVTSDPARADRMIEYISKHSPGGNPYMLFQAWEAFGQPFRPPSPNAYLVEGPWRRVGAAPICISAA